MDMSSRVNMKLSCNPLNIGLGITDITATERVWLEAAAARCPDYSQPQKYVAAMRAVAERLPDDPGCANAIRRIAPGPGTMALVQS